MSRRTHDCPVQQPRSLVRAFTLAELIVVMILLTIFASLFAPRFINARERQQEQEAIEFARVLTSAAQRCDVMGQTVAISYDAGKLEMLVQRPLAAAADSSGASRVSLRPDPLVAGTRLEALKVAEVRVDGVAINSAAFRIPFVPGTPRPVVQVELGSGDAALWTIFLGPDSTVATRQQRGQTGPSPSPRVIDLDDAGQGQTTW